MKLIKRVYSEEHWEPESSSSHGSGKLNFDLSTPDGFFCFVICALVVLSIAAIPYKMISSQPAAPTTVIVK